MYTLSVEKIRVVLYGVGAIGRLVAKTLLEKSGVEIVGAIDIDPKKIGRDLGDLIGLERKLGVIISDKVDEVISKGKPHVVIHMTRSYLKDVYDQLVELIKYGVNVISTCEELSYPYIVDMKKAEELDRLAKQHGCTVLGTGINPGFLMDTLPIVLTSPCIKVDKISITRVINASTRRGPFQKKIGAGLTVEEFKRKIASKEITGHVGLEQSIALIASALKWHLDDINVAPVEPVIADRYIKTDYVEVQPGQAAGLMQIARGLMNGKDVIELTFKAYVGAPEEYDSIVIEGIPRIQQKISPCVHGDWGTVGMVINMIPKVIKAPPGLLTMKDVILPCATPEDMRKYI